MVRISKELYEAHRELSNSSAAFLEYVKENPGSLDRFDFDAYHPGTWFLDYIRFQTWPTFINQKTKAELASAAIKVYDLIASIPDRIFSYDHRKIAGYYGLPVSLVKLMFRGVDNEFIRGMLTRGDFFYSPSAGLKCLEFNVQGNIGGGWQLDAIEAAYLKNPIVSGFLKEYDIGLTRTNFFTAVAEYATARALERFSPKNGDGDEINMAVVFRKYRGTGKDPLEIHLDKVYKDVLQRTHSGLKGVFILSDFFRLKERDGWMMANVAGKDKRIHIVVEKCNGMVPMEVLNVLEAGNVLLYDGPLSHVMSNKLNLALLSERENSDIFSPEERETIKTYIPWTRQVIPGDTTYRSEKIKLEDFIITNRERLVLKPAEGTAGIDIYLGYSTTPDQWKHQADKALGEKKWVVQEYIPSVSYLYQTGGTGCDEHRAVWGVFVFGPRDGGGFVRVLPQKGNSGVINSYQGAELGIIFEVDD